MSHFALKKTISKYYDSINTMAFSHDGSLFASGAVVIIFQGHGSGREIRRPAIRPSLIGKFKSLVRLLYIRVTRMRTFPFSTCLLSPFISSLT